MKLKELRELLAKFIAADNKCDNLKKEDEALRAKRMTADERDERSSELSERKRIYDCERNDAAMDAQDWLNPYSDARELVAELDKLLEGK